MSSNFWGAAVAFLIVAGLSSPALAAEVPAQGTVGQQSLTINVEEAGIAPLHGVEELKGADLATVGVDIAPGRGFAIMRDSPTGPGVGALPGKGFVIGEKQVTSFVGIEQGGGATQPTGGGLPGGQILPGAGAVPLMNLPVVGGILRMGQQ